MEFINVFCKGQLRSHSSYSREHAAIAYCTILWDNVETLGLYTLVEPIGNLVFVPGLYYYF